ncbi:MAG: hypothetical protein RL226_1567, partial [Bacteroidota bacterium]
MKTFFILTAIFFAIVFSSCKREEATRWDIDVSAPLVVGSLGWSDLVADSLLTSDEFGILHIHYEKSLIEIGQDSIVALSDTVIKNGFVSPFPGTIPIPAGQTVFNQSQNMTMGIPQAQIREIELAGGTLSYTIRSEVNGPMDLVYTMPGATLNGQPFSIETTTSAGTNANPYTETGVIDLAGYHFNLTGTTGGLYNRLAYNMIAAISPSAGGSINVSSQDSLIIELRFDNIDIHYARGYFGNQVIDLNQTIDIDALNSIAAGNLSFDGGLSMNLDVENFVGADVQLVIQQITARRNTVYDHLDHAIINSAVNITRAIDNGGIIASNAYNYSINESNSNITTLFGLLPSELSIIGHAQINPLGDVSGGNDFIYPDYPIRALLTVDAPLCMGANGILFRDTLALNSFNLDPSSGILTLNVENRFPIEVVAGIKFLENETVTTIAENIQLSAGQIDSFGFTVAAQSSTQAIAIPESTTQLL